MYELTKLYWMILGPYIQRKMWEEEKAHNLKGCFPIAVTPRKLLEDIPVQGSLLL